MSIPVSCGSCQSAFRVKDEYAGWTAKCPKCKVPLRIPAKPSGLVTAQKNAAIADAPVEVATAEQKSVVAGSVRAATAGTTSPAKATASPKSSGSEPVRAVAVRESATKQRPPATADRSPTAEQILAAIAGTIEPVRTTLGYQMGLVLVLLAMVLLMAAYVALIALACYAILHHAENHTWLLTFEGGARAKLFGVLLYLSGFFVGGVLVLFMIKPIFARPQRKHTPQSLAPEQETLLFTFVGRVCDAVGAPHPKRIDIDHNVNASASFRGGWWSLLRGDLVLTIGLPLVAGLNLQQFSGVLAHEFGHFTQGAGMRLTYAIRSLNWWFTRVVYERDDWDEKLDRWGQELDLRLGAFVHIARLLVWITRKILWVFMLIGHSVSSLMLRQMEYDADLHEIRFSGSDAFESTARRLHVLNLANSGAQEDLAGFFRDGRLTDNLPRLVMANVDQIPAPVVAKLNMMVDESKTGWLDTHPSDSARIAAARAHAAPGIFRLSCPSSVLFRNFAALGRSATLAYYRDLFGAAFNVSSVRPVEELLARQNKETESAKARDRYFQGVFTPLRPLALTTAWVDAPADPKANLRTIVTARELLAAKAKEYPALSKKFDDADTDIVQSHQAIALADADFKLKAGTFRVPMTSSAAAKEVREKAQLQQARVAKELEKLEEAAAGRLIAALELLYTSTVEARLPDAAELRSQTRELLTALGVVNRQMGAALSLRNNHAALSILLHNLEGNRNNQGLIDEIVRKMKNSDLLLRDLHERLAIADFPLDHADGKMSLATYVLRKLPDPENLDEIYGATEVLLDKLPSLYYRLVGHLAAIAERVETALGLPILSEPQHEPTAAEVATT